jgi:phosphoribosylamine---glycine ligase
VKVLMMDFKDDSGRLMDLALRAQEHNHQVVYWMNDEHPAGEGLVEKVHEFKPWMEWAELIVLSGNCDYPPGFAEMFNRGYPIFGTNTKAAELELDRARGQEVLKAFGIQTLPYTVVSSISRGINFLVQKGRPFAIKPWGGATDKSTTCVPKTVEDAIYTLQRWEGQGLKGGLMLQEMVEGTEIGISRFFGPNGWSLPIEESFEFKKFMNGDLGGNTGEMGTVIRHVNDSRLFNLLLEPIGNHLHEIGFVGDCNINCIVDAQGTPWPLEFTMRLGWPDFCIRQAVLQGDPVTWMAELLHGNDTLRVSGETVVGLVMAHGDFPKEKDKPEEWSGFPIDVQNGMDGHVHWQQVAQGDVPAVIEGKLKKTKGIVTAGQYVAVVTGKGETVIEAAAEAYAAADAVRWPSNEMYRTDIGDRLREDLPALQLHGFAEGMRFA